MNKTYSVDVAKLDEQLIANIIKCADLEKDISQTIYISALLSTNETYEDSVSGDDDDNSDDDAETDDDEDDDESNNKEYYESLLLGDIFHIKVDKSQKVLHLRERVTTPLKVHKGCTIVIDEYDYVVKSKLKETLLVTIDVDVAKKQICIEFNPNNNEYYCSKKRICIDFKYIETSCWQQCSGAVGCAIGDDYFEGYCIGYKNMTAILEFICSLNAELYKDR